MADAGSDLDLLRSIAGDLGAYLLSEVVFWSLSDAGSIRQHRPQLTLGSLLLTQARLRSTSSALPPDQQSELSRLSQQIGGLRSRWRANWLKKAATEIETRVNAWARAVQERSSADYPSQAQSRLMLGLLLDDVSGDEKPATQGLRARLATLDTLVRGRFTPGGFILGDELRRAFPESDYWYLYGRPVEAA